MGARSGKAPRTSWFRGGRSLVDRLWLPGAAHIRAIEGDARDVYDLTYEQEPLRERYIWRVTTAVPAYDVRVLLRIELQPPDAYVPARVYVQDGPQPTRHKWRDGALCMWHPRLDAPERKWKHEDGLVKLIDTSVVHLFKEMHFQEHPDNGWLGDEIHGEAKPADI